MNKRKIGQEKEAYAADFLKKQGYQILETNYRCRFGEVDIIASDGTYVVFVEVKYRSQIKNGFPEEAVTGKKQKIISKVAVWYLTNKGWSTNMPCRFDVIAICGEEIRWHQDAFPYQK